MSHTVTLQASGKRFEVLPGETVLEAARRAGLALPYSCLAGVCGSCKATLIDGACTYPRNPPSALNAAEQMRHQVLLCQAVPTGDITIAAREVASVADIPRRRFRVRVAEKTLLGHDVARLHLATAPGEPLRRLAGQYLDVLLDGGRRRAFSIANAPTRDDDAIELHVRRVAGGKFTEHVFDKMKERDILRFEGPLGVFFLREESPKPVVLVASGTGFAPIKSLLEDVFHRGLQRPMTLYWGGRRPKDLYLHALAERWAAEHASFKYVPVISDALPEDNWQGRTGFVHRAVMEDFPDLSAHQVYACGVPIMVDSARADFTARCRLPEEEFYADSFTTQADLAQDAAGSPR